ncbi:MAG: hypothetical protein U9N53_15100, partial [Bacteroidota bacterium]|nr:hypothetical protein [Bacteroidota bacterium]
MKKLITLCLVTVFTFISYGQNELFIPVEFQSAIEKGTRSLDGQPGNNYWQNKAKYNIRVKVDPENKSVIGEEVILYFNNSPDTLDEIVIRLYQDIYKNNARRNLKVSSEDLYHGTLISKLLINNQRYCLDSIKEVFRSGTNLIVTLKSKIYPKNISSIEIDWEYSLPSRGLREGAIGDSAFFIGYWYPQISVYDDMYGWDKYNYFGIPEFYNDFNDYDVTIDAPLGYLVWATGELNNSEKIYSKYISEKNELSEESDSITHIIANEDLSKKLVTGNIWNFKADQVPDFAFGLSNYYLWDATSLLLDSISNRRVIISTAYPAKSEDFKDVIIHSRKAIHFFSEKEPGIIFPYNKMTTFNGWNYFDFNGGMEYPMIANNFNHIGLLKPYITSHEIAHNYFPFYTGTNERLYTWLDEGLANLYHYKYLISIYPKLKPTWIIDEFEACSGTISDFPIFTTSMSLLDDDLYFIYTTK